MVQAKANDLAKIEYDSGFKLKFWLLMSVFYLMFFVRNIIEFEFPVVLYLAWVTVMAFAFDYNETKALLITFIPFAPAFQIKYAVLICLFVLVLKNFKRIELSKACIFGVLLIIWELVHVAIYDDSIVEFARGFAEFICLMVVVSIPSKAQYDISKLSRALAISSVVAFSMLLFVTVRESGESLVDLITKGFRFGISEESIEFFKFNYNANGLGYMCNMAIAGILINIHDKKSNIIDYISLAFCIFVGALTVSRTFLICLALTFVLYLLLQKKNIKKKIVALVVILVICIAALVVVNIVAPSLIQNYIDRFNVDDVTNGRDFLYDFYNDFIFSSWDRFLIGIGIQDISIKSGDIAGLEVNVPHNGYQQLVVAWGIVGFALMILFFISLLLETRKRNKHIEAFMYMPMIILLINILAGQFITSGFRVLSLIFIHEILSVGEIANNEGA